MDSFRFGLSTSSRALSLSLSRLRCSLNAIIRPQRRSTMMISSRPNTASPSACFLFRSIMKGISILHTNVTGRGNGIHFSQMTGVAGVNTASISWDENHSTLNRFFAAVVQRLLRRSLSPLRVRKNGAIIVGRRLLITLQNLFWYITDGSCSILLVTMLTLIDTRR